MGRMSLADIEDLLLQEEAEQKSKSSSPFAIPTLNEEFQQDDDIFAPKRTIFSSSPRERLRHSAYKQGRSYSVQPKSSIWEKRSPYERKRTPARRNRTSIVSSMGDYSRSGVGDYSRSGVGDYSRPTSPSPLRGTFQSERSEMMLGKELKDELGQVNLQIKQLCISILDRFSLAQMHLSVVNRLDYSENCTLAILDQARDTKMQLEECNKTLEKMANVTLHKLAKQDVSPASRLKLNRVLSAPRPGQLRPLPSLERERTIPPRPHTDRGRSGSRFGFYSQFAE